MRVRLSKEKVQNLIDFTSLLCNKCLEEMSDSIGYSMFLASCIIQVYGVTKDDNENSFLTIADSLLKNDQLYQINDCSFLPIMGSLFVLTSIFIADHETAIKILDDDIINKLIFQVLCAITS